MAWSSGTEVVHRHHFDRSPAQDSTRDEAVGDLLAGVAHRQLDDAADVIAQPLTDTGGLDTGPQQQLR